VFWWLDGVLGVLVDNGVVDLVFIYKFLSGVDINVVFVNLVICEY